MSLCALCGQSTNDGGNACAYHFARREEGWAVENRIMCDFVHRGIVVPAPPDRADTLELVGAGLDGARDPYDA